MKATVESSTHRLVVLSQLLAVTAAEVILRFAVELFSKGSVRCHLDLRAQILQLDLSTTGTMHVCRRRNLALGLTDKRQGVLS